MMNQDHIKNERRMHQGQDHNKNTHKTQNHVKNVQQAQDHIKNVQQAQDHIKSMHQIQDHDNNKSQRNQSQDSIYHGHDHWRNEKDNATEIREFPVTMERKVPKDLFETLGNAGLPRATIAASKEVPKGTPGSSTNKTVLQQHVEFWDTDNDGVITPLDTFKGFHKLGFNLAFSALATAVINGGFSYPTQKSWIPILGNPLFNVYVDTMNKAKHGSDSETFDTEGRFVPEKFEEVFSKYDRENKGALTFKDIIKIIRGNANAMDPFGWFSAMFEWGTLYLLCAKDGKVSKEDVRTCYDGTLFFKMEEEEEKRRKGVPIIKSSVIIPSAKEE